MRSDLTAQVWTDARPATRRRVLTGMRTTGPLHLGHHVGALKQWLDVQESGQYECFFLLADVQALTTHAAQPQVLHESVLTAAVDWLSVGIDPTRPAVHLVLQSAVRSRADISILLQMIAQWSEVRRNPTLKSELESVESATLGFMAYPVDQVADIYMVSPTPPRLGDEVLVPVGEDQVPHLEYARTLARRFNRQYAPVFVPCQALVGAVGRLVGTDGRAKMSKSLDNAIYLSDDSDTVRRKVMAMFTDPKRVRSDIPGEVEGNPVFIYHDAFNTDAREVAFLKERYRLGTVGDVEVKRKLVDAIEAFLEPIRERRRHISPADVMAFVREGTARATEIASGVLDAMHEAMYLGRDVEPVASSGAALAGVRRP